MEKITSLIHYAKKQYKLAQHCAEKAMEYKATDKTLADTYASMGTTHLNLGETAHTQLVRMIQEYRAKHGEPDRVMMAEYNNRHKNLMDKAAKARATLDLYKRVG